jgi:hypothetical protein
MGTVVVSIGPGGVAFEDLGQIHGRDFEVEAALTDVAMGHGGVPPGGKGLDTG